MELHQSFGKQNIKSLHWSRATGIVHAGLFGGSNSHLSLEYFVLAGPKLFV